MDKRPFDTLADQSDLNPPAQAQTQAQEAEQAKIKRTRIRQACERCKSRKTKCNNQRPCAACSAAGVACTDWRPGEEPVVTISTTAQALENVNYDLAQQPVSLNELDPLIDPSLGRQMQDHLRAVGDPSSRRSEEQTFGGSWPSVPASNRYQRTAYPYDSLFHNERNLLENASASGGFSHINYLAASQHAQCIGTLPNDIPTWSNKANERPVDKTTMTNLYDLVENKGGWKIIFMLVRPFLETTYVLWPTFHLPTFLSTLASLKTCQDPEFFALLLAIAYMALRERRTRKDLSEDTGMQFAELYWDIRRLEPTRDWSSPTAIQGMLYLSIGYMGGAWQTGIEMARTTLGQAVTKCFDAGLHRRHATYGLSNEVQEERRRTLWAVYCFDKMIATAGRPSLLRLSDIDQDEITILEPSLQERIAPEMPSLLAYHRTAIRLYMVLERIINKINMPSCAPSSAIMTISSDMGTRRYDESLPHSSSCEADHRPSSFTTELSLLDKYQYSDIPLPSRAIEEDAVYQSHLARIRSLSAFCRLLIASRLFSIGNNDRDKSTQPDLRQASDVLKWSDEIMESQRPAVEKGAYPDCGPTTVTQIAQVAKSLLPVIHLLQCEAYAQSGLESPVPLSNCISTFQTSIQLLHALRPKFDVVIRHLDPLESYARQLGVALPYEQGDASLGRLEGGDEAIAEALGVLANSNISQNQVNGTDGQQPGQTSGSGAIQALLSLSGRTGSENEGKPGLEGADAWWSSILNSATEVLGRDQML